MAAFDQDLVQAHRRAEAADGWPLLRSCPNTSAVHLLRYLDSLTEAENAALLDQWEANDALPKVDFATIDEAAAALERFPALVSYRNAITQPGRSIMTLPIKTVAGSLADMGGSLQDWARRFDLGPEGIRLHPPLVRDLTDLVPVPPRVLRKVLEEAAKLGFDARAQKVDAEESWYISRINGWDVALDVVFVSSKGWRRTHQLDYGLWVKSPAGNRVRLNGYESLWRIPSTWNFITVENVDRSASHLMRLVRLMLNLVRDEDISGISPDLASLQ
ncbi:MAG: hypothetical protein NTX73_10775 [Rhodobacterales bacterium]|nr:hypothetical protein [Rhodobacterales bacterium]